MKTAEINRLKREIVEVGRRSWQRGWAAANSGNISARTGADSFIITASGVSKGFMTSRDIIACDLQCRPLGGGGLPSSEAKMHAAVYACRPQAGAVFHAHPTAATAFAVARREIPCHAMPEAFRLLGEIPLVPYATPSTAELAAGIGRALADHDAALLANHGAVTVGQDVYRAYYLMESVESFAGIVIAAMALGGPKLLTEDERREIAALERGKAAKE